MLPNLSTNSGLIRLHYDIASGFGAQVWSIGRGYLFDLRDEDSAESGHHPHVDMEAVFGKERLRDLGAMPSSEFHGAMDALFRDAGGVLWRTLRFYELSDDGRSLEVFGCDHAALRRTLEALRLVLQMALGPGGELAGAGRATWHPWHENPDIAISFNYEDAWWEDVPAPEGMARMPREVCASTGCDCKLVTEEGKWSDGLEVATEWANNHFVSADRPNAHEAIEAAIRLREMLEGSESVE